MKDDTISIRQAFKIASPILKKRFGLFTAVLLTIFAAWVALEIVVIAGQRFGILFWAAAHVAFLIFAAGVEVGFLQICLVLCDGGEADICRRLYAVNPGSKVSSWPNALSADDWDWP